MRRATFEEPKINGTPILKPVTPLLASYPAPVGQAHLTIRMNMPDFSCLVPGTCSPLSGALAIGYVPDKICVDLHALKMFLLSFRERQLTEEMCVQQVATLLIRHLDPWWLEVTGYFNTREGIPVTPIAVFQRPLELQA